MRWWVLVSVLIGCVMSVTAQKESHNLFDTLFFLARDDSNQDGQVTDIDNTRLYQVTFDGAALFVTDPALHVLDYYASPRADGLIASAIVQTSDNTLAVHVYREDGSLAYDIPLEGVRQAQGITWAAPDDRTNEILWKEQHQDGAWEVQYLNPKTGARRAHEPTPPSTSLFPREAPTLEPLPILGDRYRRVEYIAGLEILQWLDAPQPLDALWIYDQFSLREPQPLKTLLPVEPLLLDGRNDILSVFVLGREFDGSMSLYEVDLSAGFNAPTITPILTGLIDPPYTSMEWMHSQSKMILTGLSGDFVVTTIGQPEAVYAFDLGTGALSRLSPDGTFVDRRSLYWY